MKSKAFLDARYYIMRSDKNYMIIPKVVNLLSNCRKQKMRMLLIAYVFPPLGGSRGIRMTYFIKYLAKLGWKIDVLTIKPSSGYYSYDDELLKKLPSGVRIYRTFPGFLHMIAYAKKRVPQSSQASGSSKCEFQEVKRSLKKIVDGLFIPDREVEWFPLAVVRGLKLVGNNGYDLLFSSSFPFSSHLVALQLKKITHLPWVADFGDSWAYDPGAKLSNLKFVIRRYLEKKVLKNVSSVILTTEETRRDYLKNYSFLHAQKVNVLTSGYDPEDFKTATSRKKKNLFHLVYTGTIYGNRAKVQPFFEALRDLIYKDPQLRKKLKFSFVGSIWREEIIDIELKRFLEFTGFVSFQNSINYMKKADILVIWGNTGGIQIPGKVFQYIGAKKPILAILGDERDPLKRLLKDMRRGFVVDNEKQEIAQAIRTLYSLWKRDEVEQYFDLSERTDFCWEETVKELEKILLSAARGSTKECF